MENNKGIFYQGFRHGIPIGLGYFAVAFSLGISARDFGFNAFQGFLASLTTYASAGQYIGFTLYAANATLLELILLTVITNARYILMGFALNQRMPAGTPMLRRILVGTCITDEIFGITIARPGVPTPYYTFGAVVAAVPLWALGTALGITMGSVLPARVVSALSVALFGMFLAVIIPPSRKDKAVCAAVLVSFACSFAAVHLPYIAEWSQGNRTILLTIVISAIFALLFPRTDKKTGQGKGADSGDVAGAEDAADTEKAGAGTTADSEGAACAGAQSELSTGVDSEGAGAVAKAEAAADSAEASEDAGSQKGKEA